MSNFDEALLARSVAIAGPGRVACDQVLYHLKERAIEHRVVPACHQLGVAIVGYSPFGSGDFPEPSSAGGRVLAAIAERHGATPRQVALAFLTRLVFAIPKASRVGHVEENVIAGDLVLTPEEVAAIDRAFPRGPVKPLPMI